MTTAATPDASERLEVVLGRLLRVGVTLAATLVLLGGVFYLVRHGRDVPNYHLFRGESAEFRTVGGILAAANSLSGRGIIQLGLLVLIATPVARVLFSVYAFARQGDWIYVVVTLIVLLLLLYSLFGG